MELKEILSKCDHTLLAQTATWEEIRTLCDDGIRYGCASVCIPASYVRQAAEYVALFARHIGPHVKIKAAGGIADLHDAQAFIELGASRLGTSRIVKAVKAMGE